MPADLLRRLLARARSDEGASTVDMVLAAPLLLLFGLLVVGLGLIVQSRSSLDGAARDAARAGALQRDYNSAVSQATQAAKADAAGVCEGGAVRVDPSGDWRPGGLFTVTVSCEVPGLRALGLNMTTHVSATSTAPLDTYRRTS
ncbi:TadE/TadG family type IV pilus assembly protein [Kitasatospora sp. NPDC059088]|uniref:TadE/TadG family type IV pilus assembly protein n=1 Tax=Kitasatospora sp. NPDC059088 TaxID=3346722 RepID=UPI003674268F